MNYLLKKVLTKISSSSVILGFFIFILFAGTTPVLPITGWEAPASADKLKNPLQGNNKATLEGKKLFKLYCSPCHGNKGKGDGIAGMSLKPRPTNLTSKTVQAQTDGAIFWKITEGRPPMASYKDALPENQRWQMVNFIRDLAK